jgi:Smg protein
VIERAIALENIHFGVEELKWIVLMVLMNQPGQENAYAQMEDLIYNEQPLYLH